MGLFSKLFGASDEGRSAAGDNQGSADPSTVIDLEGRPLISVEDVFPITGRGLTVTGPLQQDVQVDDQCQVRHQGRSEVLRVSAIQVEGATVNRATTGTRVALLVARRSQH